MIRILCVCLGNICRSPAAEEVLRKRASDHGIALHVESAGTGGWHIGDQPDARMQAAAARRGYDLSPQRAQQVTLADFDRFDMILAMDQSNLANLKALQPAGSKAVLRLFLGNADVPDPYYGDADGFDHVLDLAEAAVDRLLREITL